MQPQPPHLLKGWAPELPLSNKAFIQEPGHSSLSLTHQTDRSRTPTGEMEQTYSSNTLDIP